MVVGRGSVLSSRDQLGFLVQRPEVFFGQVDSALDSNPGPGFFCWWVKPLDGGVKLCPRGRSCS